MPDFSLDWRRGRNFEIYLAMDDLVMALRIEGWPCSTVQYQIWLISNKKINAGGIFVGGEISRFRYNLGERKIGEKFLDSLTFGVCITLGPPEL